MLMCNVGICPLMDYLTYSYFLLYLYTSICDDGKNMVNKIFALICLLFAMPTKSKKHTHDNLGISVLALLLHLRVRKPVAKAGRYMSALYTHQYVRMAGLIER
jgi:hypothetical protein